MKRTLLNIFILTTLVNTMFSQQIVKKDDNISISNKEFKFPFKQLALYSLFENDSVYRKYIDTLTQKVVVDGNLSFQNCRFYSISDSIVYGFDESKLLNLKALSIYNCNLDSNFILNTKGITENSHTTVSTGFNKIKSISIRGSNLEFNSYRDTLANSITIDNSVFHFLMLTDLVVKGIAPHIKLNSSKINKFQFNSELALNPSIVFNNDTIYGNFNIGLQRKDSLSPLWRKGKNNIEFNSCYVDANFNIGQGYSSLKITFNNCVFGPNTKIYSQSLDTLRFSDCFRFAAPIYIYNYSDDPSRYKPCNLSFGNSDVSKINFSDYGFQFKLSFSEYDMHFSDNVYGIYGSLYEKFRNEGKILSRRNIDIEFKQMKYKQTYWFGGDMLNFFDRVWWYYGYNPRAPIYWTLRLLLLFFIINIASWRYISKVYNVNPFITQSWHKKKDRSIKDTLKVLINIFVFTTLVFFSIYVNFEKISFKKTRWLLLFFFQYLLGIFCLFFLLNAILKF